MEDINNEKITPSDDENMYSHQESAQIQTANLSTDAVSEQTDTRDELSAPLHKKIAWYDIVHLSRLSSAFHPQQPNFSRAQTLR